MVGLSFPLLFAGSTHPHPGIPVTLASPARRSFRFLVMPPPPDTIRPAVLPAATGGGEQQIRMCPIRVVSKSHCGVFSCCGEKRSVGAASCMSHVTDLSGRDGAGLRRVRAKKFLGNSPVAAHSCSVGWRRFAFLVFFYKDAHFHFQRTVKLVSEHACELFYGR